MVIFLWQSSSECLALKTRYHCIDDNRTCGFIYPQLRMDPSTEEKTMLMDADMDCKREASKDT